MELTAFILTGACVTSLGMIIVWKLSVELMNFSKYILSFDADASELIHYENGNNTRKINEQHTQQTSESIFSGIYFKYV